MVSPRAGMARAIIAATNMNGTILVVFIFLF
jgi:hypothetical protein